MMVHYYRGVVNCLHIIAVSSSETTIAQIPRSVELRQRVVLVMNDRLLNREKVMIWAAMWRANNRRNGLTEFLIRRNCLPKLFKTRREARVWIEKNYGYLKEREDLRAEPLGWLLPRPVKVRVERIRNASRKSSGNQDAEGPEAVQV